MLKHALAFFVLALALPNLARADQIQLLDHGDQGLAAFYASIQGAHSSIDLATYVFEACDSVPKLLLDAMVKKARAGVHVRLFIDAYSLTEPTKSALPAYLAGVKNFELRYYNDAFFLLARNKRSHVKALVVDGATYIVGGRNMQDDYFGLGKKMNYVDNDLLVTGASSREAQNRFNELWAAGSLPRGGGDARAFAASCLAPSARDAAVAAFVRTKGADVLAARPVRACPVLYTIDRPDFENCQTCSTDHVDGAGSSDFLSQDERYFKKRTTRLAVDFISGTSSKLELLNQYYMPPYREMDALTGLRRERKTVEVMANATGDIDDALQNQSFTCYMQSAAAATSAGTQRVSLLTSRGALGTPWALSVPGAPWRIHAKSGIRDGKDVLVSSFNLDPRSYAINLESGAVVSDCPDLAADLETSYQQLRDQVEADKTCAACASEILPGNQAGAFCGGVPDLY